MRIGLTLPHFSDECTWDRLIGFAPEIESLGYDSVWARDHISFEPGQFDPPGRRFIDPFVALAAIAGATNRLRLGFAVIVPLRHPVVTTQLAGSLAWVSGDRVELGIGIGGPPAQFGAVGIDYADRIGLCEDTLEIMALAAKGEPFSFEGKLTKVTGVHIEPAPAADIPVWYGGYAKPALRRAVRYCTGIMPSRTTFAALDPATVQLRDMAATAGRDVVVGSAPVLTLGRDRADALARIEPKIPQLLAAAKLDPAEASADLRELDGALIAGNPAECAAQLRAFADRGIDSVVLDLRLRMADFEQIVRTVAAEVLPALAGT